MKMKMKELQKLVHEASVKKGVWKNSPNPSIVIPYATEELGELAAAFRKNHNIAEEMADVLICIMDAAEAMNIDLETEIRNKININKKRTFINAEGHNENCTPYLNQWFTIPL